MGPECLVKEIRHMSLNNHALSRTGETQSKEQNKRQIRINKVTNLQMEGARRQRKEKGKRGRRKKR